MREEIFEYIISRPAETFSNHARLNIDAQHVSRSAQLRLLEVKLLAPKTELGPTRYRLDQNRAEQSVAEWSSQWFKSYIGLSQLRAPPGLRR